MGEGDGSGAFAVTVLVQLKAHPGLDDALVSGWLGVELTWWTGLAANQLDLPLDSAFEPN